jgi:hypothetical protein
VDSLLSDPVDRALKKHGDPVIWRPSHLATQSSGDPVIWRPSHLATQSSGDLSGGNREDASTCDRKSIPNGLFGLS